MLNGGRPSLPASIQGVGESPLVCTPVEIITGQLDLREESIVVVGSGMTGLETAEILSHRDRNNAVLVLEAAPRVAPGVYGSNRNGVTWVLEGNNVVFLTNRTLTKVGQDRIWFADSQTGEEYCLPRDWGCWLWHHFTRPMPWRISRPWGARCSGWGTRPKAARSGTPSTTATTPPAACEAPAARRRCVQKRHGNLTKPCWSILQG